MADYKVPAGYEEVTPGYHNFQEEPVLEGILTEKEEHIGENNSTRYTIERKSDNEQVMCWGSTVLDGRMKPVKIGEEIVIWYQGEKPSEKRKGKFYHDWRVYRNTKTKVAETVSAKDLEEVFGK